MALGIVDHLLISTKDAHGDLTLARTREEKAYLLTLAEHAWVEACQRAGRMSDARLALIHTQDQAFLEAVRRYELT